MSKKFKFSKDDLDDMLVAALNEEPGEEKQGDKPNALKMLLAKAGIGRGAPEGETVER